jgi:inner membrane protein
VTSRTHDVIAFSFLVTTAVYFPPEKLSLVTALGCLMGGVAGSLLPDIDQASNRLWDMLPGGNIVGKVFKNIFLHHRTISHSLLGGFLLFKGLEYLLPQLINSNYLDTQLLLWSVLIGFGSHLLADAFTEKGIPLLFPLRLSFGIPPVKPMRMKTGGWFEKLVVFPGVLVYLFWFSVKNKDRIISLLSLIKN